MNSLLVVRETTRRIVHFSICLVTCALYSIPTLALELGNIAGGSYSVPVTSFADRKFETIYKQEYDFSCGSAALASMLTYHYDDIVSEHEVFVDMYKHGDQAKIKQQGFSLLDMKKYLERRGYQSNGFQVKLQQLNVPAITIINMNGYMHFVVIKGFTENEVLIGDPSAGIKSIDADKFQQMWNNRILFMIYDRAELASASFQSAEEWSRRVKAPVTSAINRASINRGSLLKPGDHDF